MWSSFLPTETIVSKWTELERCCPPRGMKKLAATAQPDLTITESEQGQGFENQQISIHQESSLLCSNKEDWNNRSRNHHFLPPTTVRKHHNLAMIRTSSPASTSLLSPVRQAWWSLWRWSERQRAELSSHRFRLVFRNKVINGVGRGGWLLRTHYP